MLVEKINAKITHENIKTSIKSETCEVYPQKAGRKTDSFDVQIQSQYNSV